MISSYMKKKVDDQKKLNSIGCISFGSETLENLLVITQKLSWNTSATGLRGDLRSMTFGLLFFGVLVATLGEDTESGSDLGVLS